MKSLFKAVGIFSAGMIAHKKIMIWCISSPRTGDASEFARDHELAAKIITKVIKTFV